MPTTGKNVTVDISDAKVSADPVDVLVTYSLGSCIGVSLYDPVAKIGGMLHCLLPEFTGSANDSGNCFKFADTGVKRLLEKIISMGAVKRRLQVKIAGGAKRLKGVSDRFDIGKRNYLAVRKILWKNAMMIKAEDVGGTIPRTMYLDIADGGVMIRSQGKKNYL
jgi:chemotaxis protein CheD